MTETPTSTPPPGAGTALDLDPAATALGLLADGVPLSLLLDLAATVPSRELFREERGDTGWVPAPRP